MLICIKYILKRRVEYTDISMLDAISLLSAKDLQDELHHNTLLEDWAMSLPGTEDEADYMLLLIVQRELFEGLSEMISYNLISYEVVKDNVPLTELRLPCGIISC